MSLFVLLFSLCVGWKNSFSVIIGGDEVRTGKPSPEMWDAIMWCLALITMGYCPYKKDFFSSKNFILCFMASGSLKLLRGYARSLPAVLLLKILCKFLSPFFSRYWICLIYSFLVSSKSILMVTLSVVISTHPPKRYYFKLLNIPLIILVKYKDSVSFPSSWMSHDLHS